MLSAKFSAYLSAILVLSSFTSPCTLLTSSSWVLTSSSLSSMVRLVMSLLRGEGAIPTSLTPKRTDMLGSPPPTTWLHKSLRELSSAMHLPIPLGKHSIS
eukprot:TRINITY_DN23836_c0_g1_i1.p1 TRINITY_DN23836_c0_g1~~TRINITY_DN23836_c0_g1_i1.p1  ORF type:complete len:100 (-),score=35.53 TRINITY_DN23836_c0_g1_i1:162-461(-)